ncbi:MAG: transcriptional regulator, partial [Candidatus Binatia bacterium]
MANPSWRISPQFFLLLSRPGVCYRPLLMLHHFATCELDDQLYQLRRDGTPVEIEPKVFDVLAYLLHHRDRLVSKDEILDKL